MDKLKLELTLEQKLEIERLRRTLPKLSRDSLEKETVALAKLYLGYLNAFKSVYKTDL